MSGKSAEIADTTPDTALIRAAITGDRGAMETLFTRHETAVFRFALRVLHHADDADDVRQETFVRVFGSLTTFRGDAAFRTFALAICANLCRDRLRCEKRRPVTNYGLAPHESQSGDLSTDPHTVCERTENAARVRRVVDTLAPSYREVLHLRYVEELSGDEIAHIIGCSRLAVPVRVFRAKKAFEAAYRAALTQEETV